MAREIFTRAERKAHTKAFMQAKQDAMTPEQIGALMYRTIWEAIDARGAVENADLLRANVPEEAIITRSETILAKVLADRAAGKSLPVVAVNRDQRR